MKKIKVDPLPLITSCKCFDKPDNAPLCLRCKKENGKSRRAWRNNVCGEVHKFVYNEFMSRCSEFTTGELRQASAIISSIRAFEDSDSVSDMSSALSEIYIGAVKEYERKLNRWFVPELKKSTGRLKPSVKKNEE